jgi:hypothetical protein
VWHLEAVEICPKTTDLVPAIGYGSVKILIVKIVYSNDLTHGWTEHSILHREKNDVGPVLHRLISKNGLIPNGTQQVFLSGKKMFPKTK